MKHPHIVTKYTSSILSVVLFLNVIASVRFASAQIEPMLAPATGILSTGTLFKPPVLCGIKTYPHDPLKFDFIIDAGDQQLSSTQLTQSAEKLIRYFLACLTIPEKDLWVNLSPYENNRIIPDSLGQTEAGRDLLEQDYLLKQIASSLIYPETDLGKTFWDRIYKKAYERYGTTQIPVNTFHKIWIVPERATIYKTANQAVITSAKLKVMLEKDFLAEQKNIAVASQATAEKANDLSSDIIRDLIVPEIENEVNEGKNFSALRQIFFSLILATWFKNSLKSTLLSHVYVDQKKVAGIDLVRKGTTESIYHNYVRTFQKGVFDFIKIEQDPYLHKSIPRKYFSGGFFLRKSTEWMDERDAGSSSLIVDQEAAKIYKNSSAIQVHLAPESSMTHRSSSIVPDRKGLRKFLVIAAFSLMVGVVAPFSNLFAGTTTDRYVGEKYGNSLYQTEDGRAYSVVPKWGDPHKATGTVSGIGAAAIAYAQEIGMNIPQGTTLYWDVVNSIAKENNISPESGYLIQPGDTVWITKNVTPASLNENRSHQAEYSSSTPRSKGTAESQGSRTSISQNSAHSTDLANTGPSLSDPSQEPSRDNSQFSDPTKIDSVVQEHHDLQGTWSRLDSLQEQIVRLEKQIHDLLPQKSDTASKIIAIGNPPPPEDDSLKIELAHANQNIALLMQQLDDLKQKKKKITVDFERKVEAKLSIKDGVGTIVSKGGDAKFTIQQGKTKFEANFKFEGSMKPGVEEQSTYIKKHFLLEQDSIFGQPIKARAGWNFNHATDPYFLGFDVYPQKIFSKKILLSAGLDAYYPMVSLEDDLNGISDESRQRVYMPRIKLDWKINDRTMLSLKGEGAYSQDPFSKERFSDEEYTLSLKRKDKKGEHTFSLVQGFTEPKTISNLTSLSTDPGPYRIGYERGLKILGSKGAIGGYWAFDTDFKTQGAKIWIKFNGPLDHAKWKSDGFGTSQTGIVFSSETDFTLSPDAVFSEPDPITTYGDMEFGMNFKNFLRTTGNLYFGLRSDLDLHGPSFKTSTGQISKPQLNLEYDLAPENSDISSIHFGVRQGNPMIGLTLTPGLNNRFALSPEANIYYLGSKSAYGNFLSEINILSGLKITDRASLWANPRILWPSEGEIGLGGSLTLLLDHYGFEFFKDFSTDPDLVREIGYLPYGYDWRLGPVIHFPSFSGGIFYGQENEKGFFGIRAALKINKNPQESRRAKIQNDLLQKPFEKKQKTSSNGSSSALLLAKDNLFKGSVGESNLSLWTYFKERLKHLEALSMPEETDRQRPGHILFINAFGPYENVVEQVHDALAGASEDQLVYLTIELHTERTVNHIAALLDARSLFAELAEQTPLQEILTGVGTHLSRYIFYVHLEEILQGGDVHLKSFLMTPRLILDPSNNNLKKSVLENLISAIHARYPKKRIFASLATDDHWLSSQLESHFRTARISRSSEPSNGTILEAFVAQPTKTSATSNGDLDPTKANMNGGVSFQGQYLQSLDLDPQSQEPATFRDLPLDLNSIQGFIPINIHIVPFTGFYTFLQSSPSQGLAQLAAHTPSP